MEKRTQSDSAEDSKQARDVHRDNKEERKSNWLGHLLRRYYILNDTTETVIEGERERKETQLLTALKKINRMLNQKGKRNIRMSGEGLTFLEGSSAFGIMLMIMIMSHFHFEIIYI